VTAPPQGQGFQIDTGRLVVASFVEAMHAFEGQRYQQQLAEVTCVGLSWIVEDRLAGVNAPEWPALCDQLLGGMQGDAPAGFAEALRGYDGMSTLAGGVIDLAKEHKVDLAEFAVALTQAGTIAKQVAKIRQGGAA
jgi:hypothetical protein